LKITLQQFHCHIILNSTNDKNFHYLRYFFNHWMPRGCLFWGAIYIPKNSAYQSCSICRIQGYDLHHISN